MQILFSHKEGMLHLTHNGVRIPSNCIVRNELNNRRRRADPSEVVYAMTEDPYVSAPYMPRQFPLGTWSVYSPVPRDDNPYLAPFFIPTSARQLVDVWKLDSNGGYSERTGRTVVDYGYGLHFSSSNTTLGCIRIHSKHDLLYLTNSIKKTLERHIPVLIEVTK